jgi:hypothetical protein
LREGGLKYGCTKKFAGQQTGTPGNLFRIETAIGSGDIEGESLRALLIPIGGIADGRWSGSLAIL